MVKEFHLEIDASGRMVIPNLIRKELNIKAGMKLIARLENGEIHLTPIKKAVENARALVVQYCGNKDLLNELFIMRQEEVKNDKSLGKIDE